MLLLSNKKYLKAGLVKSIVVKSLVGVVSAVLATVFVGSFNVLATTSSSFELDFDTLTTGSQRFSSNDFQIQSGITPFETNSTSSGFQVVTHNLVNVDLCGNGVVDAGEVCDGGNLNGQSCSSQGFDGGALSCSLTCTAFVTNACFNNSGGGGGGSTSLPWVDPNPTPPTVTPPSPQPPAPTKPTPKPTPQPTPQSPATPTPSIPEEPEAPEQPVSPPQPPAQPATPAEPTPRPTPQPPQQPPATQPQPPVNDPILIQDVDRLGGLLKPSAERETSTKEVFFIDETPLITGNLEPNENYEIQIRTDANELIEKVEITTDRKGQYLHLVETKIPDGGYVIEVYKSSSPDSPIENQSQNQNQKRVYDQRVKVERQEDTILKFNLREDVYDQLKVIDFGQHKDVVNDFNQIVDLGEIVKRPGAKITGRGIPGAKIKAYFQSPLIYRREAIVAPDGSFEIDIPQGLGYGGHHASLIQIHPDQKTISKNLTFEFELIPFDSCELKWLFSIFGVIVFLTILNYCFGITDFKFCCKCGVYHRNPRKTKSRRNKKNSKKTSRDDRKMI